MKVEFMRLIACISVTAMIFSGCTGTQNNGNTETTSSSSVETTSAENDVTDNSTNSIAEEKSSTIANEVSSKQSVSSQANSTETKSKVHTKSKTKTQNESTRSTSKPKNNSTTKKNTVKKMSLKIGNNTFTATLEDNAAADALADMMRENPIVIEMNDYSGFEKVGSLGTNLPTSNSQTTTHSGDIVLYNGNQIVIFYGSNSWSYTRLGKIDDLSGWESALGSGDITVTFSID